MNIPPANITQTESSGAKDRAASVAEGIALEMELEPENPLLPEKPGEELWRVAGAELVEVSRAEFSDALETIGARDNYGLDSGKQANERQRTLTRPLPRMRVAGLRAESNITNSDFAVNVVNLTASRDPGFRLWQL